MRSGKGSKATTAAARATRTSSSPSSKPPDKRARKRGTGVTEAPERYVGGGVPRKEDPALVTGRANWTDNIKLPGMLHMSVLRSPFAHAKITHLDVSDALEQPGVVAAFTGNDLAELWKAPMPCAWPVTEDIKMPDHWPLAKDEANFMGDAVAVVIASDRYTAQDALEFIVVDYEPLEVVLNMEDALKEDAPLVHEDMGTNQSYVW
ncbi:MAG: xanthine dehydrogenase family protein molybdopterin-binding subunit, partial [Rubrobacter sp.]|nr:xanthine dehydrogenase family protein molybdopterin-binding subunit [Rubrobacter sp.]